MPTVEGRDPLTGSRNACVIDGKPSISCIATQAYWSRLSKQRELKYATSFQKSQEYLDGLREEVSDVVFKECIHNNTTPLYVYEELKGIHHTPQHPLINKGLLASSKHEQFGGYTTPVEQPWPSNRPKPQPANRSFYRPNSTHNYLTKTIALGGSHDGFNPKHGTPTRAQLLRNRVRFTSAPDLTYSYIAHRTVDGKQEAFHRKAKMAEEALQLKASKIEMDRTAGKYRKYMIGSRYNTAKWIDSHMHIVNGMVATRNERPASSFTPKSTPLPAAAKRRATSAVANSEHLRCRAASAKPNIKGAAAATTVDGGETTKRQTYPISSYAEVKREGAKKQLSTRSPNLVPYTASVNRNGPSDILTSSIIIKSAVDKNDLRDSERAGKRIDSGKHLKLKIASSRGYSEDTDNSDLSPRVRAPTPSLAISAKENAREADTLKQEKETIVASSVTSQTVFMTDPPPEIVDNPLALPIVPVVGTKLSTESSTNPQVSADLPTPAEVIDPQVVNSGPHSVSIEMPNVDNKSDTLSKSAEYTTEDVTDTENHVTSAQMAVHVDPSLTQAAVKVTHTLGEASDNERPEESNEIVNSDENILVTAEESETVS